MRPTMLNSKPSGNTRKRCRANACWFRKTAIEFRATICLFAVVRLVQAIDLFLQGGVKFQINVGRGAIDRGTLAQD